MVSVRVSPYQDGSRAEEANIVARLCLQESDVVLGQAHDLTITVDDTKSRASYTHASPDIVDHFLLKAVSRADSHDDRSRNV